MTNNRKPELTTDEKKAMFLFTLPILLWNISRSCEAVNISRAIFYHWLKEDPDFANEYDLIREQRLDYIQEKSLALVSTLDGPQIRFELNALGKSRGYGKPDSDRPPLPPSQHLHFHLPPQPASLADWEQQTIEARKARAALPIPNEDLQQNLQPVTEILSAERVSTPLDVLNGSADSGEEEEEEKNG